MENKTIALIICAVIIFGLLILIFYIVNNTLIKNAYQQGYNQAQIDIIQKIKTTSELPEFVFNEDTNLTYITWKQFGQFCLDNVCRK